MHLLGTSYSNVTICHKQLYLSRYISNKIAVLHKTRPGGDLTAFGIVGATDNAPEDAPVREEYAVLKRPHLIVPSSPAQSAASLVYERLHQIFCLSLCINQKICTQNSNQPVQFQDLHRSPLKSPRQIEPAIGQKLSLTSQPMPSLRELVETYLSVDMNPDYIQTIQSALANDTVLAKYFGTRPAFGTAGIRGAIGPGYANMNAGVILQTAKGYCAYSLATLGMETVQAKGIVIG
jgi:hypothetical protein